MQDQNEGGDSRCDLNSMSNLDSQRDHPAPQMKPRSDSQMRVKTRETTKRANVHINTEISEDEPTQIPANTQ